MMPDTQTPVLGEAGAMGNPALAALLARASVPSRTLQAPAPGAEVIETAVAAALRAPDHGGLRPWRFVAIEGTARDALGALLADSLARREPETPPERLELERAKPLRAPLVLAAGAKLAHGHKIPVWEQEASAAAGIMNLLNALDAQGFGAMWVSGGALRDPAVKTALGFAAEDALLGWIYIGTPPAERPRPARPDPAGFWRSWQPG
jgi:nitroreductase